jgi:hypothetical protein
MTFLYCNIGSLSKCLLCRIVIVLLPLYFDSLAFVVDSVPPTRYTRHELTVLTISTAAQFFLRFVIWTTNTNKHQIE